jgi:hypothetical protein
MAKRMVEGQQVSTETLFAEPEGHAEYRMFAHAALQKYRKLCKSRGYGEEPDAALLANAERFALACIDAGLKVPWVSVEAYVVRLDWTVRTEGHPFGERRAEVTIDDEGDITVELAATGSIEWCSRDIDLQACRVVEWLK